MKLSVVTPTYNEAQNLPKLISALLALPEKDIHVIIVDDNSPDGTGQVAEDLAGLHPSSISVIHRRRKFGLGSAYITGFKLALDAGSNAIAQMDADLSHPPDLLMELLASLEDYDVAMGSRYITGGGVDTNWPWWRKRLSTFGNQYARYVLGLPVQDVTGGYKVWKRETLAGMPLNRIRSNGYAFQVEMAYVAYLLNYSFVEKAFYFPNRDWGKSKMSFRIQLEAAYRVWKMRFDYRDLRD